MLGYTKIPIDKNWTFKQADDETSKFLPVAQFPTNVHLDLIANGIIADPFIGKNENDVQWVGEVPWVYTTIFSSPTLSVEKRREVNVALVFEGLDTFATVRLNGHVILESDNMFTPERVDVSTVMKKEGGNELEINFQSAYLRGCALVEEHPDHKWGCWNGDTSRLAVRKAQYHWGWDWGPTLMTCGPWRPIFLEIYSSRISDLYCEIDVHESLKAARITANVDIEGTATNVNFDLSLDGKMIATEVGSIRGRRSQVSFEISDPVLWYPIRYGPQPLYTVTATLLIEDKPAHTTSKRIGLRRAELVQRPLKDQPGTSFFFRLNGIPIFCGGSNWIPADSFLPRISRERYHDWVKLVADGNQFMIRVWGGGIYEEQAFYDACDELGILVWQDFMFGCGNYPAYPEFLKSVKREAVENVKRLRHHPSIVIWAGNNEDYQYCETEKLTYDPDNKDADSWLKTDFPARYIYEKILVDVCQQLIPDTYYHFGSPWGGKDTTDPTVGDIHQWNVWHGSQEKYQNFDKLVGRFVSEFGMEAFPNIKTIDSFLPLGKDDPEHFAQSSTVDFHNKAAGHERRLALYLVENFRYSPDPLEQFIYTTQLMQAECLASAYRLWQRQWKGPGREYCGGALVWQIDDCWPVTSWAIVDYYLRPKHAYYAVKREMAPITLGVTRKEHLIPRDKHTRAFIKKKTQVEIWACNLTLQEIEGDVVIKAFDVVTGKGTYSKTLKSSFSLPENRSTEILTMNVPVTKSDTDEENRTVLAVYLFANGTQIARYMNWPEPLKYVYLQKPKQLKAQVSSDSKEVSISSEVPVKGVALECDDDGVKFEDNLIDVVPGEVVTVKVTGLKRETKIRTRYLGMQ